MAARLSSRRAVERWPTRGPALAAFGVVALAVLPVAAQPGEVDDCMDCHEDADDEFLKVGDGTEISIDIKREPWDKSVHAKEVGCTDCHTTISEDSHPDDDGEITARTVREFQLEMAKTCKRCHYANYTRVVDGIHFKLLAEGNDEAPTCVDCHGAHDTLKPGKPCTEVDKRCAKCHEDISKAYERSVHGQALINDNNPDVPVCTDCHGAHRIRDPRKEQFHASSYRICARCHSDEERMDKYDLNTAVVDTYLNDFHGRSNAMYADGVADPGKPMATCTDCHGIHDIPSLRDADKSDVRARVIKVCSKCHESIPEGFEDAWLSHYPPTLASAPIVWLVTWFYRIIIPFILIGLSLHILLHFWRFGFKR